MKTHLTIAFCLFFLTALFFSKEANGQGIQEDDFPQHYENPQMVKFYKKSETSVTFWLNFDALSSNLYERAFLASYVESRMGYQGAYHAKRYYKLELYHFAPHITEENIREWVIEGQKKQAEIRSQSQSKEYEANLKTASLAFRAR